MLRKQLVVLLLLVLAVGAYAQSIPSGTGRIEALGNTPFVLDAATDMFRNPVWAQYYKDYAFGDIGRDAVNDFQLTGQYAGVSFGVGKKLALGFIVNKRSDQWESFRSDSMFAFGNNSPVVPFMGLIAYSLNKDFHIGLAPYYASWGSEFTTTSYNDKRTSTSLGASLGALKMIKKGWVEGVVNFRMNSYKRDVTAGSTTTSYKSSGGVNLGVNLRGWIYPKTSSKIALVPVLGFNTFSWNPEIVSGSTDSVGTKYSMMNIMGAVGLNWPVADDIALSGGVGLSYNTAKGELGTNKHTVNDFVAPQFYLAGETRIADWLTGRFGFYRAVDMNKDELVSGSTTTTYTQTLNSSDDQTISLGAGFHFGRFSIDATVSEKWLKQGINFVSGRQNDLFGVVSASYNFNNK